MDEGDRIYMTELLAQLKTAKREKEEALREMTVWLERVELAEKAGKLDLMEAARERAERYAQVIRDAESHIMKLEVEKSAFKKDFRAPDTHATEQAQHLLDEIKDKPWSPEGGELDKVAKQATADDALAALKRKMSQE